MKNLLVLLSVGTTLMLGFSACSKKDAVSETQAEFSQVAKTKAPAQPINFTAPMAYPEGMVYNPFTNEFLVSSIAQGTIGSVTHQGVYTPFIVDPALASTAGMEIDKARKRLLVTNSRADGSLAQLAIYDLTTKTRLHLVDLGSVGGVGGHLANDVAIDKDGNAYITDSFSGISTLR